MSDIVTGIVKHRFSLSISLLSIYLSFSFYLSLSLSLSFLSIYVSLCLYLSSSFSPYPLSFSLFLFLSLSLLQLIYNLLSSIFVYQQSKQQLISEVSSVVRQTTENGRFSGHWWENAFRYLQDSPRK